MQRPQVRQPVQQELLVQQELPGKLEPLVCKSLAWQPELRLGEQLEQVLQLEVQLVEQRVPAAQPEVLSVLALLALLQPVQLARHRIRRR
jgi:hypothetical protein